jgi:hypothetical protein
VANNTGANNVAVMLKAIKPAALRVDQIRLEILNALRAEGREVVKEHEKTVATWQNERPKFEFLIGLSGGNASVLVGPTGDDKGVQKWNWLNQGTRIRWALMSRDWQSKTTPRFVGAGRGQGRVLIAGRRAMMARGIPARPGIIAREWTVLIQERRKDKFRSRLIDALQRARAKLHDTTGAEPSANLGG